METSINPIRKFNLTLFISLGILWLILWFLPWTAWFDGLPWLRLSLAGLVFIAPGMFVSLLLMGNRFTLPSHVTSGLVLSMFLVSSLGVIGKIAHLPFGFIKPTFFVVGLITFLMLAIQKRSTQEFFKPKSYSIISIAILLLIITFGAIISFTSRLELDDFSYLAYLTNWQHSTRLNFGEVVFGSGKLEATRYWLALFPMNHAFLSELSCLHGVMLLGYYLRPVLVVISLLSMYNLYEDLLHSDQQAVLALLVQFTFLFLLLGLRQPGSMFFLRITEDKSFAAFALAPVFFLAVRCFLESPVWRRGIFVLLSGWSLALVHPIILAYSVFIAGVSAAFVTIVRKDYKALGIVLALLVLVMVPSAPLRFISLLGLGPRYNIFDLEAALKGIPILDRISYIEGTPFYGFNLERIRISIDMGTASSWQVFLSWSYLWFLVLGFLWSLSKLKKQEPTAPFIAASALLVFLCAIPYTGWLVGYFVSARMLWRSPWLFPSGSAGVMLVSETFKAISSKMDTARQEAFIERATFVLISAACIGLIGYFSIYRYQSMWQALERLHDYRNMLEGQAALGDYIEANLEQPSIFLASDEMMNYLPGLSSKAKVVYFRSFMYTHHPVNRKLTKQVLSSNADFSIKRRINVLRVHNAQYLLIEEPSVQEYYAAYLQFFNMQKFGNHWLLEDKGLMP